MAVRTTYTLISLFSRYRKPNPNSFKCAKKRGQVKTNTNPHTSSKASDPSEDRFPRRGGRAVLSWAPEWWSLLKRLSYNKVAFPSSSCADLNRLQSLASCRGRWETLLLLLPFPFRRTELVLQERISSYKAFHLLAYRWNKHVQPQIIVFHHHRNKRDPSSATPS